MALVLLEFVGSLAVLLTAARFFTVSAENVGNWLRLPAFVTGIFIVGVGTSLPELVTGTLSVVRGQSEIVPGNIIGANVSNVLLLLGAAMVITGKDIVLGKRYLLIDLHYLIGSAVLLVMFMFDGAIRLIEGLIGGAVFIVYSFYLIRTGSEEVEEMPSDAKPARPWLDLGILALCSVGIYFGASYTVDSVTQIAERLEIPPAIIALTMLSLGTTLPELAVNYFSMRRGKTELAVGNILGSCIFNSLVIPTVATMFGTIAVPQSILDFPLLFMPVATFLFYLLALDKRISCWEGILLIAIYGVFVVESIGAGH
jgi:cation:H+ antiporter